MGRGAVAAGSRGAADPPLRSESRAMGLRLPRRSSRVPLLLAALCAVVGAAACRRDGTSEIAKAPAVPPRRAAQSVVVLCVDTLRADALGTAADGTTPMPALTAFAKDATTFSDAVSSSSWTAPSVATLLTGLESRHTGVRGARVAGMLPPSVTTLAESLKEEGFSTAAITGGGWVAPSRGLGQGFDSFSTDFDAAGPEAEIAAWARRRPGDAPFFLFLHTTAAHDPYGPKDLRQAPPTVPWIADRARAIAKQAAAADGRLPDGAAPWLLEQFLFRLDGRLSLQGAVGDEGMFRLFDLAMDWLDGEGRGSPALAPVLEAAPAAYRAGLAHVDRVFERTKAALEAVVPLDDVVFVVCGDHGEALGEHGTLSHGRWLYDETVRVPLVVRAPGRLPRGAVVAGSCGLVDVTPTVLSLAGAAVPAGLDGVSLRPLAAGEATGRPVFAEEDRSVVVTGDRGYGMRTVSVRTEAAKYLITFDLVTKGVLRTELYDLTSDPRELSPLEADPSRFGPAFCRAAAALRAQVPGLASSSPCLAIAR